MKEQRYYSYSGGRRSKNVASWFDKRARTIEDEYILRGSPDTWNREFLEKDIEKIQYCLSLRKTDCFLDIGCGNGLFLKAFAPLVKAAVGIDLSLGMLLRISSSQRYQNLFFAQADSCTLPFKDRTFDVIICNGMIHYLSLEEIPRFMDELKRVGKPAVRIFLGDIPVVKSLRGYEARIGRFLSRKLKIKISDKYISPVETTRFSPKWIENIAEGSDMRVVSKGIMRHVLPSLYIPPLGPLVPKCIQYLFSRYDYERVIPWIGNSYFFMLVGAEEEKEK